MTFKRIFKRNRHKNAGNETPGSPLTSETPPPTLRAQSASPTHDPSAEVLALATQPFFSKSTSALRHQGQKEEWPNLGALSRLLNQSGVFGPLAEVMDDLCWFIRVHEDACAIKEEYKTLRAQLEGLCGDLRDHFSKGTPPVMTTSMHNLCRGIQTELREVYGTQDRNDISRYLKANQDLDKITGCYRRIHGHLERVMLNASLNTLKMVDDQATEARLRNLNPSMSACYDSAEADIVQRRECAPKTREQVLRDLEAWKNNLDGEKVCWINGMAGTGKTTIATSLCSTLHKSHELGASFFCTRSIPACRDVKLILPSIAYQLARFSIPFRCALLQVLDRDPDVHTKAPRVQFQRMIFEPLRAIVRSLPSMVVVIDALDECDEDNGVEQILEVLLENLTALPIKFLISSRPEHHIRNKISKSTLKTHMVLHELDEKMVKSDIETYLRTELTSLSIFLTEDQLETLVEGAGVLFIFAATVVRYVGEGDSLERLHAVLAAPCPDSGQESSDITLEIDGLYNTILVSALSNRRLSRSEKQRMELVLHTVVCVQEPLTIASLAGLLGHTSAQVKTALKPLWSVLHVSGPDTTDRVSTLHASFPDYMLDPNRAKQFACNAEMHNGKLAKLCMMRIGQNAPQFNICGLESSYLLDNDIPDLNERVKLNIPLDLLYACQYWAAHLSKGGTQNKQTTVLHEFLSKRLLLWMEVLNLSKRIDRAVGQIEEAISWLKTTEPSDHTVSLARDAMRFATMFATSPVCQSTPHLYVSMLSSWPDYQPVSQCYARQTKSLVKLKGMETTERQLSLLSLISVGSQILSVSYSPTGTFFAAGTWNHKILIWDAASCRMTIDPIIGHTSAVQTIAISPDGAEICSGSRDCTLRVWDTQSGRLIAALLEGNTSWVYSAHYSPSGQWLACGLNDGTVRIWDTRSWQTIGEPLDGQDGRVTSVAFSPDNATIAAGSRSLILLWDPLYGQSKGKPLSGHTDDICTLAFTPDGKYLVSGSDDHTIRVWDVGTSEMVVGSLQEHLSEIDCITLSPNGKLLASAAQDNTIRIWDTQSWTTRSLLRHTGIARSVAFLLDGSRLLSGSVDGNIRVWEVPDASDKQTVEDQTKGHSGWIRSVAFSLCGAYIISGSNDMTVRMWDAQNGQSTRGPLEGHNEWVTQVGVSADGNNIFSVSMDRMIHVWDIQTGQLQYTIGPVETDGEYAREYQEFWPAILFDDRRVVCGSKSGRIYLWQNDTLVYELTDHCEAVYSLAVSPDGQSFLSGDNSGNLIMWSASTGEALFGPFEAHVRRIYSITFASDGSLVASGSVDHTIRLWSPHTGSQVGNTLRGHTDEVRSVAFSPQGKHLVSGSDDMTVRLWDIASGQSVAVFEGHTDWVYSVAFSPDGTRVASASGDMAIRIWNASMPDETPASGECECRVSRSASITDDNVALSWTVDENGWVKDNEHRLLAWVPPDLRSVLLRSHNKVLISPQGCIELSFSNANMGKSWSTCYEPFPPATKG